MTGLMKLAETMGFAAWSVMLRGLVIGTIVAGAILIGRRLLCSTPRRVIVWLWISLLLFGLSPILPGIDFPIAIQLPQQTLAEAEADTIPIDTAAAIPETPYTDGTVQVQMPTLEHDAEITIQHRLSVSGILGLIWAAGMAAVICGYAADAVRVHRMCRHVHLAETPGRVKVFSVDGLRSPFVRGIFRPKIYMPSSINGNEHERMWIMEHELAHVRRGDPLWRLLWQVGLCVYWFQPLLWYAYRAFVADTEGACDETVLLRCGDSKENRADYAQTLLVYAAAEYGRQTTIGFGVSELHGRITAILQPAAVHRTGLIVLAAVIIVSAGLSLLSPSLIGKDDAVTSEIREEKNTVSIGVEPSSELFGFVQGYVESHPETWSSATVSFELPVGWEVRFENPDSLWGSMLDETGAQRGSVVIVAFSPIDGEGIPPENIPPNDQKWQAIYRDMRLSMMQNIADDDYRPIVTRERSEAAVAWMDQAIYEEGVPAAAWEHQRVPLVLAYDQDCSMYVQFTFDARTDTATMESIAGSISFIKTEK